MRIDFHVHTFLDKLAPGAIASLAARSHFTPFTDGTVADTERLMKEQGVDKFVALNIAVAPRTARHVNDFAISLLSRPNIIPFGSVHPASEHALEELARLHAAGVRAIKTVAQTAAATIGTAAALGQVDWRLVASASVLAGVLSLLTSVAGLPELPDADGDGIPDSAERTA